MNLKQKLCEIFETEHLDLGLMRTMSNDDTQKYEAFLNLVDHDLTKDHFFNIVWPSDREPEVIPRNIVSFMTTLAPGEEITDPCAGTGTSAIYIWCENPIQKFTLMEENIRLIPYLLFNMVIRNIHADVICFDALHEQLKASYHVRKGEKYGFLSNQ